LLAIGEEEQNGTGKCVGEQDVSRPNQQAVDQSKECEGQKSPRIEAHEANAFGLGARQLNGKAQTEQERKDGDNFP
jgi:hypothetical protein